MLMTRRGFLGSILAAAVAPAIVRADSLMRIVPRDTLFMDADLLYGAGDFTIETWLQVPALRRCLQVVSCAGLSEVASIDIHRSINGSEYRNVTGYRYLANEVTLELPPGANARALTANGEPLDLRRIRAVVETNAAGLRQLRIHELDLTPFGNLMPAFEVEVES